MLTKDSLKHVGELKSWIGFKEKALEKLRAKAETVPGIQHHEKVQRSHSGESGNEKIMDRCIDLASDIDRLKKELHDLIDQVEAGIDRLDIDDVSKEILLCRYVYLMGWVEIADTVAYCERTVYRKHRKALNLLA